MRKVAVITLIIGVVMFLVGIFLPIILLEIYTSQNDSIGIIGGADTPSILLISNLILNNLPHVLMIFGGAIILSSLFCIIFTKTVNKHCTLETSSISLGLSASASLGIYCVLVFISCHIMSHPSKHPITYPTSIILGLICLAIFAFLIFLYTKRREAKPSAKGVTIDIIFALTYLIPFFFTYSMLHNYISDWI